MEEQLERIKEEVQRIDRDNLWYSLFQKIRQESLNSELTCLEAKAVSNKALNRYRDVSPYDHTRIVLKKGSCSYINASLVKVEKAGRNYILTQGPLNTTSGHFWLMVWEQKSKAILMLNKIIEKDQIKCHQYWPIGRKEGGLDEMVFDNVNLKVTLLLEHKSKNFTKRTFRIEELDTNSSREVLQFHYLTWPDFGVPSTPRAFLHFLQEVRDSGALENDVGPAVVHCSAGIGRSGTFCLVDSCLLMMKNGCAVDVKEILLDMRKCRMGLIQTADQLKFSYLAISEGAEQMADGTKRFMPDDENQRIEDEPPEVPPRISSIPPNATIPARPLPPPPSSSESDTDDLVIEDSSDETDTESSSDGVEMSDITAEIPEQRNPENAPVADEIMKIKAEENSNGHTHCNEAEDDSVLRRRAKVEATMAKVREIKQKQKESDMKAELYEKVYRSLTGKKFLFCLGFSMVAMYLYSKV